MKPILVQIYEIQEPREAEALLGLGVDHMGSVLLSRREWKVPAIREVTALLAAEGVKSCLIPLFNDLEDLSRAVDYYEPRILHFCEALPFPRAGGPDPRRLWEPLSSLQGTLKARYPGLEIMRSIPVPRGGKAAAGEAGDAVGRLADWFAPVSDCFLTDTLLGDWDAPGFSGEPVAGYVGITGETCDWDLAAALVGRSAVPVILAGGISPENVFEGILKVRPAGVDSCTGTNARDPDGRPVRFRKDRDRVRRLVEEVRRAERSLSLR
jgi:phosphoribosylanthranilate isomerase